MISGGATLKVLLVELIRWEFDALSGLWISIGCFLLILSIFGIAAAVRESTLMTNVYGILLSLIFILQMAATITAFVLMGKSSGIAYRSLHVLMGSYDYDYDYRGTMNWLQTTFSCCGNEGPSDYGMVNGQYSTSTINWRATSTISWWDTTYYTTADPYHPTTTTTSTTTEMKEREKMPQSCCTPNSGYKDKICESHFTSGCHDPLHAFVSESVMRIGSFGLGIAAVQIFGIIGAFLLARIIRRKKTNRDIQRWAYNENMGFDRPAFVDQKSTPETRTDEIKHI